jgi:hypothetical protein
VRVELVDLVDLAVEQDGAAHPDLQPLAGHSAAAPGAEAAVVAASNPSTRGEAGRLKQKTII